MCMRATRVGNYRRPRTLNSKGVNNAMPAFWIVIGYLMEGEWTNLGERVTHIVTENINMKLGNCDDDRLITSNWAAKSKGIPAGQFHGDMEVLLQQIIDCSKKLEFGNAFQGCSVMRAYNTVA
ncbi:hypothetical protein EVAR_6480_1 [Eumeta japonica]|uniref:Uncharacterized protein n=1 Tax=Eumeta variegata TaxID=151549 RepID=A0A4C1ST64_EUMVA|nr:hypothetical protein EVAR_6480_1 [Eumeta japonica]